MKTTHIAIIVVLSVLALVYLFFPINIAEPKSTLVIAVKDAPKSSEYGTITSLSLTFSEVSVHKASTEEEIDTTIEEMDAIRIK